MNSVFGMLDGNKRKIVGGLFTLASMLGYFGVITPEITQVANLVLSALFGASQVDAMAGYPGRPTPVK